MPSPRTRFSIALPFAMAYVLAAPAAFASEVALGQGGVDPAKLCAAEAWPNISAECAGAKAPRAVRVISLGKEAPSAVPLPASVQAAYASKSAEAKPVVARDLKVVADVAGALPITQMSEEGASAGTDGALVKASVAAVDALQVKKAARKQERAKKVARAQRQAKQQYAADYGEPLPAYADGYGRQAPVQQGWNRLTTVAGSAGIKTARRPLPE